MPELKEKNPPLVFGTNILTNEDFKHSFKAVVEFVLKVQKEQREAVSRLEQTYKNLLEKIGNEHTSNFNKIETLLQNALAKMGKEHQEFKQVVTKRVDAFEGGQEAKEQRIVERTLAQIEIPKIEELKNDLPIMGTQVRDSLELLQGEERLDISAIKGVDELKTEIKASIPNRLSGGGGGVIQSGPRIEIPEGTVNGANVTFTAFKTPLYIIVDGVTYFEGNGYALSGSNGKTLTVTVPPTGFIRSIS